MRVVVQRVTEAIVETAGTKLGSIQHGLLLLLGITENDGEEDVSWLCKKLVDMRIFNDEDGKMNRSVKEVNGGILVVSQFTLHASTKKGNRPSFVKAAQPAVAIPLYESFVGQLKNLIGGPVETGRFGAYMQVAFTNDGPVTIIIDSKNKE